MRLILLIVALLAHHTFAAIQPPANCINVTQVFSSAFSSSTTNKACIGPCDTCTPTPANVVALFYTVFSGQPNVFRTNVHVDDANNVITADPGVYLASSNGADGIVSSPESNDILFVGGQDQSNNNVDGWVNVVNISGNPGNQNSPFTETATANNLGSYHLTVVKESLVGVPYLFDVDIANWRMSRISINAAGTLNNDAIEVSLLGASQRITTLIVTPNGFYYTYDSTPYNGYAGEFGSVQFQDATGTSALLTVINTNLGCYHSGYFDPFSNSLLTWGDNKICQYSFTTDSWSSTTVSGASEFDQGTPDGLGHLFIADNAGVLWYMRYQTTKNVATADKVGQLLSVGYLDDVAPLIGAGGTCN